MKALIFIPILAIFVFAACAPYEKLEPLYSTQDYTFSDVTLRIPTVIDEIPPIEPTGFRRFVYKIPIFNRLLAIPFDLTNALIPPLGVDEYLDLPAEDENGTPAIWADREFLGLVKSIKIIKGWLREKSPSEVKASGGIVGDKKSWLCSSKGIKFIKEMKVIFEYHDPRFPNGKPQSIPVAYTNQTEKYLKKIKNPHGEDVKIFNFDVNDDNLRPYIDDVRNFRLKLETKGKLPCEKTFMQAGLEVEIQINIKKD